MSQKTKYTAEHLLEFFTQLDPGGAVEDDDDLQYGSFGVIKRGLEAAKMLIAVREIVGSGGGAGAATAAPAASAEKKAPAGDSDELKIELMEARREMDAMLGQNMELRKDNKGLKEKLALLQRQVERLYNKNEMATTLSRLENKKLTEAELGKEGEMKPESTGGDAPQAEPASPAKPAPSAEEIAKATNKELQEELSYEAAARAPKEEKKEEAKEEPAKPAPAAPPASAAKE